MMLTKERKQAHLIKYKENFVCRQKEIADSSEYTAVCMNIQRGGGGGEGQIGAEYLAWEQSDSKNNRGMEAQ